MQGLHRSNTGNLVVTSKNVGQSGKTIKGKTSQCQGKKTSKPIKNVGLKPQNYGLEAKNLDLL